MTAVESSELAQALERSAVRRRLALAEKEWALGRTMTVAES
jgi:hypothetical protein